MRKINKTGLEFIKRHEGFVPHVYLCPANYLTIGYGHLCLEDDEYLQGITLVNAKALAQVNPTELKQLTRISYDQAEKILQQDLYKAESAVIHLINSPLTDNQFAALISFTFNLGSGALQRSTLRRKLNRAEYLSASNEFNRWVYAGGYKLKGLIRRRFEEYLLFLT
jgi:lysozyme